MNTQTIIQELNLTRDQHQINMGLAQTYDNHTPRSLYMDPYELQAIHPCTQADQWEQFLDIPEIYRYRTAKIAKLQEFAAIKAMKALEEQGQAAGASAVSALKEIANLSKQLNQSQSKQTVILTYVSQKVRHEN